MLSSLAGWRLLCTLQVRIHPTSSPSPSLNLKSSTAAASATHFSTAAAKQHPLFSNDNEQAIYPPKPPKPSMSSGNLPAPNESRPAHAMGYFPGMTTTLPSASTAFRRVLWTGLYSQVVLMNIPVGGDIGEEIHTVDQILTFTSGRGLAQVGGRDQPVAAGDMVVVPAGTKHQFLNVGNEPLVLYTVYSPAEHSSTTVHATKAEGDRAEEEGVDEPPEWSRRSKQQNEADGWVKAG